MNWVANRALCAAAMVFGVTGAFFALFAWDHERIYGSESSGPYAFWQGALMVVVLLVLTVGATRRGMPLLPPTVIPPVLAYWFGWDWSQTDDSGLWALGVMLLGVGSFLGTGLAVLLARSWFAANDAAGRKAETSP